MSYLSLIPMHCMIFYPYLVFGKPRGVCLPHVENAGPENKSLWILCHDLTLELSNHNLLYAIININRNTVFLLYIYINIMNDIICKIQSMFDIFLVH